MHATQYQFKDMGFICGFPPSLQASILIALRLCRDCFHPNVPILSFTNYPTNGCAVGTGTDSLIYNEYNKTNAPLQTLLPE